MLPLVSIITPSFNQAKFLEATILSVLRQDYPHIEYIVMDGGSTDGSVDLIRRYEDQLSSWISERDGGQSNAINRGFARSSGTIFAWVNSDDLLAPSAVRIAVDALERTKVGVVYGDRIHIDARGNVIGINRQPSYYASMFKRNFTLPQETVFFRRSVFDQVGGLDETLKFALDFDLWVRMSRVTAMHHVPAFLGSFREHGASKSVNAEIYLPEHARVYRQHFGRPLPGAMTMRVNRVIHKSRLFADRMSSAFRGEEDHVRQLMAQPMPAGNRSKPLLTLVREEA
jgi:glycosyltransferase involved in cell wall biosynthesis